MNEQIRRLYREHPDVVAGPDLYPLVEGRPELFRGTGDPHPNAAGNAVIRHAWAELIESKLSTSAE